jgi:hypothetical protein
LLHERKWESLESWEAFSWQSRHSRQECAPWAVEAGRVAWKVPYSSKGFFRDRSFLRLLDLEQISRLRAAHPIFPILADTFKVAKIATQPTNCSTESQQLSSLETTTNSNILSSKRLLWASSAFIASLGSFLLGQSESGESSHVFPLLRPLLETSSVFSARDLIHMQAPSLTGTWQRHHTWLIFRHGYSTITFLPHQQVLDTRFGLSTFPFPARQEQLHSCRQSL